MNPPPTGQPHPQPRTAQDAGALIVVGSGPVGMRAAQLLAAQNPHQQVLVFGEEAEPAYNRVQLSLYLNDEVNRQSLTLTPPDAAREQIQRLHRKVTSIDRQRKLLTDDQAQQWPYKTLVLATGSRALTPELPGRELHNVHCFRTLADTEALRARKKTGKHILVVGSGPLGIEAAAGMKTPGNSVQLLVRRHLLDPALDSQAQQVLQDNLNNAGIEVIYQDALLALFGSQSIEQVQLQSGRELKCDTLIFCTGVSPNTDLARQCGLEVARGILVNDQMQTTDPAVYAVGECAEHRGQTYGIVAPGFEQAESLARHLSGNALPYRGSSTNIQLKFGQQPCGIYGQQEGDDAHIYCNRLKGIYRKLVFRKQTLVGFVHIGPWPELASVRQAMGAPNKIRARALEQFEQCGLLWNDPQPRHIKDQPADYLVCLCEGVNRGSLTDAMQAGNRSLDSLCQATGAGLTCGSCKPLLAELLDAPAPNLVMRHHRAIYGYSLFAIALMLITLLVQVPDINGAHIFGWQLEKLWFDNFWKQVSGYTLLLLSLMAGALALRKRWKRLNTGHLDNWRYAHSVIGVVALLMLMVHTGLRLGENLNLALMMVFLAATLTGSLVGVFMARNHHWTDLKLRQHRAWWSRVHYSLLWMLPALLTYHILAVYYF